jgi:hypothetical protein
MSELLQLAALAALGSAPAPASSSSRRSTRSCALDVAPTYTDAFVEKAQAAPR